MYKNKQLYKINNNIYYKDIIYKFYYISFDF